MLYKYPVYDYDNGYKTLSHTFENIYCPKLEKSSTLKTIQITDCRDCRHHKSMIKNEQDDWGVACRY